MAFPRGVAGGAKPLMHPRHVNFPMHLHVILMSHRLHPAIHYW
jgi:hypothetical protein